MLVVTMEIDYNKNIPEQIKTANISPIQPDGKGAGFIPKKDILKVARELNVKLDSINPDAWSEKNGATFVSWKGFYKLPEVIQTHFIEDGFKKGLDFGIKTGTQQDGRFFIVFDCDGIYAKELKDFIIGLYGQTFIRSTPSGGYHIYYHSPKGSILTKKQHVDLRAYLTIEGKPIELEIKQGDFVKEIGKNRETVSNIEITELNPEIDFIQSCKEAFNDLKIIKPLTDNDTITSYFNNKPKFFTDNELVEIFNSKYLPRYIQKDLDGVRDNSIIPATFGFLISRNFPRKQMETVLRWINNTAESQKLTPDKRNYNFDNIPKKLAGSGVLRKHGFDDFINAINMSISSNTFEVYLPREPTNKMNRAAVYPNPKGEYSLSPMMELTMDKEDGDTIVSYQPIVAGLEIIESHVYFPIYEDIGITTYDVELKMRGQVIKYNKITSEKLKSKLEENHAAYFNYIKYKSSSTIIEIIHQLALVRGQVGWTAGGKGIYYDENKSEIVAEDIPKPQIKHVKKALLEIGQLFGAMYPETRDEMAGIMLWFLSGAFNLVRKQLGFDKYGRQPSMINAGDVDRGKSEAPELGSRLWYPYHEMLLTERNSTSFGTRARRRESMGVTTIPIRVEEFDGKANTLHEFEEDLRDIYNMVYSVIQQQNGDIRRTMMKSLPYISTNDKMMFQNPAFAKRAIIYETSGSIPKDALKKYSKQKEATNFEHWPTIGAMATHLVIDGEVGLKQPWDKFALELIKKIYEKVGLSIHEAWTIPEAFTQESSIDMVKRNVEENLLQIMQRAIINKIPGDYDEDTIVRDITVLAKTLKTRWLFLLDNGSEDKVVIKSQIFENAKEDHRTSSIPRGGVKMALTNHGGKYKQSGLKMIGSCKSGGIIIPTKDFAEILFGERAKFVDG